MASAAPSNSYYQSNIYPLVADFLDDFDYAQDSNTTSASRQHAVDDNRSGNRPSSSTSPSSSSHAIVTADLLDGDNQRYLPQQQYYQRSPNLSTSRTDSVKNSRRNYSESSIYAQNDVVAVAQPVTFQDNTDQTQLIYRDNNNNYYNDPYSTTTALTTYNKELLPPKVQRFKQKRKVRTAVSTGAGVAVGGLVAGPLGMVVGGYGAYAISKSVGKHRERKMLEKCLNDEAGVKGANWETISRAVVT